MGFCGGEGARAPSGLVQHLGLKDRLLVKRDPAVTVEQRVQSLRALRQVVEVALQHFGESVEQRPRIAVLELRMVWIHPLISDLGNVGRIATALAVSADNEVVSLHVNQVSALVSVETLVLNTPRIVELTKGLAHNTRQIPEDKPCMATSQLDLTAESEVVTNEHRRADRQSRWELLVVRVADAKHRTVILTIVIASCQLHQSEVTITTLGEGVSFFSDGQIAVSNLTPNFLNQLDMRNGVMRLRRGRRGGVNHLLVINRGSSTM